MSSKMLAVLFAFTAFFAGSSTVLAQASANPKFQDGIHFTTIENAKPPAGDKIIVVEAFSYMCTHCNTFDPYISGWLKRKPEYVQFQRIPVVFGRGSWELYARAYTTAEIMGIANEAHEALMDKIWKEREVYRNMEELAEFYSAYGVTENEFLATSKSFAVDAKLRKDQRDVQAAGVRGTPSLIVNNQYLVSGNEAVSNYDVMLNVVDFLVAAEYAKRPASAAAAPAPTTETAAVEPENEG